MNILYFYVKKDGNWSVYEELKDRRDYVSRVKSVTDGRTDAPAVVMQKFICENAYVLGADKKLVMRALRHFDEVGLSNDLYEILDGVGEIEAFALTNKDVSMLTAADLSGLSI